MAKRYYNGMNKKGMIHENRSERSNLPQEVMNKEWPSAVNYTMGPLNDLFDGAQRQMKEDIEGARKAFNPKKY